MGKATKFVDIFGHNEIGPVENPFPTFRRLRQEEPVILLKGAAYYAHMVTRFDDCIEILKDDKRYSNRSNSRGIGLVMGKTIVEMDGPEHTKHRNLVTPSLAPRALRGDFMAIVDKIANEIIDDFAGQGEVDLVKEFTFNYPLRVFTTILGLPAEDVKFVHETAAALATIGVDPAAGFAASAKLKEYLAPLVKGRRDNPEDDLLSKLCTSEVNGEHLTDEEIISFVCLLVLAGAETTYHLLGSALYGLLTNQKQLAEVRDNSDLVVPALDETLRWESPVGLVSRLCEEDVKIGDYEIAKGEAVILALGSANRDENKFDDPDQFNIHRGAEALKEHRAFGLGKHFCAGSRLAYAEAKVGLEVLLKRLPNLRFQDGEEEKSMVVGLAFRGPNQLPVQFDA